MCHVSISRNLAAWCAGAQGHVLHSVGNPGRGMQEGQVTCTPLCWPVYNYVIVMGHKYTGSWPSQKLIEGHNPKPSKFYAFSCEITTNTEP